MTSPLDEVLRIKGSFQGHLSLKEHVLSIWVLILTHIRQIYTQKTYLPIKLSTCLFKNPS